MLYVDTTKMLIEITRGDNASIVFSATDSDGETWHPTEGDILTFAVSKKLGADPVFSISNSYNGSDEDAFWTIEITPKDTAEMGFKDYVWDVQVKTSSGVTTIIGKTDTLSPAFRVWGEVAK